MQRLPAILILITSSAFAEEMITYDDHVFPIFQQSCLNCHNPDKTKGGLDLSSFSGAIKGSSGGKIVEPGDLNSSLISAVQHTGEYKMPPEGEKLAAAQIEILKNWINGGLLENKSSSARKVAKPKFETALRSDPAAKPDGPPPMPEHLLLEPVAITDRAPSIHSIAASPWAPVIAITGHHQILLHHTGTLELIGILPFPEGDPVSLTFTPDGRYLIAGGGIPGKSGVTITFDITHGTRLLTVAKEFDAAIQCDIRPSFDLVATGGPSRLLKLWNTQSGDLVKSVKKHTDWITALDFSPDGVLLATGDRNGGVYVWESETCGEFHTLRAHQSAITTAAFRSDSNLLATSSEDGTVRFWEMNGGTEVKKLDAHPGGVIAFAFARDGSSITAGRDLKAKLWKPDFNLAKEIPLTALPTAVAANSDGDRAFIADVGGIVHVFQRSDGKPLGEIKANPPLIADRLATIATQIAEQQKAVQAATSPAAARSQLAALQSSQKLWTAAAINTRALATRRETDEATLAIDEQQLDFTRAAAAVATQAAALNSKRAEHARLARGNFPLLSPESKAELAATLDALNISILRQSELFEKSESALIALHANIDQTAPLLSEKKQLLASLITAYQEHLK